ncbi:MAG TPA: ATP-binding cassette domain-containing protein [Bacteroidales bacterium]|nr:ATP-binding cassette domain-containing protein [Bacteroidales bacterium]
MQDNNMPLDTIISFKDCTIYQQDHLVLRDVNLEIKKGEFVYLIGKVGSGKTSLIKTINAQIPLKEGEAIVAGHDLSGIRKKDIPVLRRKLGIVFQDFQLLTDRSAYSNLEFVLKATGWKNKQEIEERIGEVLEKVGLGTKGYKMPHQLSGGEQQRVVIARALLNDPDIILADEPTGNLDPETSEGIIKILMDISKNGRAVVFATHNYTLLKKFVARTIKCKDSRITETYHDEELEFI